MKKIITTIFTICIFALNINAQEIKDILIDMPRDIIYGLNPELNEMLLDNPKDTSKFVATAIYEKIERKAFNANFISLQTSEVGTTDIRLLPLINESKIICLVQTVCGTICDSKVSFYTDKWILIDAAELLPTRDLDWFIKADTDKSDKRYINAIAALDMFPMKYTLSAEDNAISIRFNPKSFMTIEDYKAIEPFLTKEAKVLQWDKVKFK